jgi:hypothetical protein
MNERREIFNVLLEKTKKYYPQLINVLVAFQAEVKPREIIGKSKDDAVTTKVIPEQFIGYTTVC